jgi:hypothetical protein
MTFRSARGDTSLVLKILFFAKFWVKLLFCRHYFSPLNTFMRKRKDPEPDLEPDPYLWLMNPDAGDQKTWGSIRFRIRIPNTEFYPHEGMYAQKWSLPLCVLGEAANSRNSNKTMVFFTSPCSRVRSQEGQKSGRSITNIIWKWMKRLMWESRPYIAQNSTTLQKATKVHPWIKIFSSVQAV